MSKFIMMKDSLRSDKADELNLKAKQLEIIEQHKSAAERKNIVKSMLTQNMESITKQLDTINTKGAKVRLIVRPSTSQSYRHVVPADLNLQQEM